MSDNLDKLKGHGGNTKQDINRRGAGEIKGKEGLRLNKRINDIAKVISDPDVWNVNIASRERLDEIEQRLDDLIGRINGVSYIMKSLINNRGLTNEDVQIHLDRDTDDNNISGSTE